MKRGITVFGTTVFGTFRGHRSASIETGGRRHVPRGARSLAAVAATAATFGLLSGTAAAANSVQACFVVGGQAIPVSLAGLEATDRYGNWVPLSSAKVTQPNGCVSYVLWGKYTTYNLRVVIAGVTHDQTGLIVGASRWYAPGAYRGYYWL